MKKVVADSAYAAERRCSPAPGDFWQHHGQPRKMGLPAASRPPWEVPLRQRTDPSFVPVQGIATSAGANAMR
jgi:hypothetical protein